MDLKEQRLRRLFRDDGKTVIVPIDHGIRGVWKGLEDPYNLMEELIKDSVDGTLMQFGILKLTEPLFMSSKGVDLPSRILTTDYSQTGGMPDYDPPQELVDSAETFYNASVEQAAKHGCDAVKVLLPMDLLPKAQLEHYKVVSEVVKEADRFDMPVIIEPLSKGSEIPKDEQLDPKVVADNCRIALELGADIIKAPYTGDKESFALMVERLRVPVIVLGGPKAPDIKSVLQIAKDVVDAGAKGTCFGRNVWGRPQVHAIIHALLDIVHNGKTVEEVLEKFGLQN